jgi:hypothetical protein
MMFRNKLEGIGLLGVPPRPTYSSLSRAFIASETSPGLRSFGSGFGGGSWWAAPPRGGGGVREERARVSGGSARGEERAHVADADGGGGWMMMEVMDRDARVGTPVPRGIAHLGLGLGLVLGPREDGVERADGLFGFPALLRRATHAATRRRGDEAGVGPDDVPRASGARGARGARARARGGRRDGERGREGGERRHPRAARGRDARVRDARAWLWLLATWRALSWPSLAGAASRRRDTDESTGQRAS